MIPEFKHFLEDPDLSPHIEAVHHDTQRSWLTLYEDAGGILKMLKQMVSDFRERGESLQGEFGLKAGRWLARTENWRKAAQHPTVRFNDRFKKDPGEFDDEQLKSILEGS